MSMFYCRPCGQMRDADDGAHDIFGVLICADCVDEMEDDDEEQDIGVADDTQSPPPKDNP